MNTDDALQRPPARASIWTGRVLSTLVVLFLAFDAIAKLLKLAPVMEASQQLGIPEGAIVGIGATLLVCTILYVIPQTAVLGAILLTGYLGGAIFTHVRVGGPVFPIFFAGTFGILVWLGLCLCDPRLWAFVPWRR